MRGKVKKIFLASTSYNLEDVRPELARFLKEELKQEPTYFESPIFRVKKGLHSHDVCIDAVKDCDMFLLIIDRRYGGDYRGNKYPEFKDKSITWAETVFAHRNNIPIYTFVRQSVWDERPVYKAQKNKEKYKPFHVDDPGVFDFIDSVVHLTTDNWIDRFTTVVDLKDKIVARLGIFPVINVYSELFRKYTEIHMERLEEKILKPQKFYVFRKQIEDDVRGWIEGNKKGFATIVGIAGCGKTHLLFNLASEYLAKNYAVLLIESDWLENFKNERLEGEPFSKILTSVKNEENKKTLLLLDTLDLVAYNRGIRKLIELIGDIRSCDEALIIGAIRPPDYENVKSKIIIDEPFFLKPFDRNEVRDLLNRYARKVQLVEEVLNLLSVPLYAHMFMEIPEEEIPLIVDFIHLYEKYWDKKVASLREGAFPSPDYSESIRERVKRSKVQLVYSIVSEMFHRRLVRFNKTDLPKVLEKIDNGELAYRDLLSEHVLIEYGNYIKFWHSTFFDYSTARYLLENMSDTQLTKTLYEINLDDIFWRRIVEFLCILAKKREKTAVYELIVSELSASSSHFQHISLIDIISNLDKLEQSDIKTIENVFMKNLDSMDYMLGLMTSGFWKPQEASFSILEEFSIQGDYETRRRIAEALRHLAPRNIDSSMGLIDILRNDHDKKWKTDIRRRIVEVVPYLIENDFLDVDEVLKLKPDDEVYVIIAIIEALSCLKQKNPEKADKILDNIIGKLEKELRSFVIWAFDSIKKIENEPKQAIKNMKAVIYENNPCFVLSTGDDVYRIFVSRNLYRLLENFPSDIMAMMNELMSRREHNNVRRPIVRHVVVRKLIQFSEDNPDYRSAIEKLLWTLATDKDPIIPITFSDELAYVMKLSPEVIRKIIEYYHTEEGKNILGIFPEGWRKIFLRRLEDSESELLRR